MLLVLIKQIYHEHSLQNVTFVVVIYYSILTEELLQTDYDATTAMTTDNTNIFQKCRSHLKILGSKSLTRSKSHTEHAEALGDTVQNLVVQELRPLLRTIKCKHTNFTMIHNRRNYVNVKSYTVEYLTENFVSK